MKKKKDAELMSDFNSKYSNFGFNDFFIDMERNNGKYERIFYKIFELEPNKTGLDTLREMSNTLKRFNPINESLKLALAPFTKEVEDSYSKAQDDSYGS
jgi:hypothetical protein